MTFSRRSFLGTILAAASAPAFVRAESLMKIWVPSEPESEPEIYNLGPSYGDDWTSITEMHKRDIESSIFFAQKNLILPGIILPGMILTISHSQTSEHVLVTSVEEMITTSKVTYKKIARMVK